jgi:aminoglycoside 2''-phosphotransferase
MKEIGEGFSGKVYETEDGLIVRIAQYLNPALKIEFETLDQLVGTLPVAVPTPGWFAPPSDDYPYGAVAFAKLPGKPLQPGTDVGRYAFALGSFLTALHRTPPPTGLRYTGMRDLLWKLHDTTMPFLKNRVSRNVLETMFDWWATVFADDILLDYQPTLCHGDLWYENVLVENGIITGIIDWENVTLGDPMMDFAPQYYLGEDFAQAVMEAYQGEINLHRIQRWRQLREWFGMRIALHHDPDEFEDALTKIAGII